MALPSSGAIAISDFNILVGASSTANNSISYFRGLTKAAYQSYSMGSYYGYNYYLKNNAGNCNNGNCGTATSSGNIQCQNCYPLATVNCVNCDSTTYIQPNCNCACTYNCSQVANQTYNCNCNCMPSSCFLAGSEVIMADGSIKNIEDIKIGDFVKGAYGESNQVLAYDRPILGDRRIFIINGEHSTTDEHTHMRADRTFGMINIDTWLKNENFTKQEVIVDENGTTEMWFMPGTDDMNLTKQLEFGEELWTINGPKKFSSLESKYLPPETQLYNLVLNGSHTYFVEGYCTTGFINGRDFDYKTWTNVGKNWTSKNYKTGASNEI